MAKLKKKPKTRQELLQNRFQVELRQKAKKLAEEIAAEEELLEGDIQEGELIPDEETTAAAEALKKELEALEKDAFYGGEAVVEVPAGPVSFDELEAAQAAQKQAMEVANAGYDAQMLVRNILNHPMMEPKAKATAIKDVGTGFEKRISTILSAEPDMAQKDLDILSLESILAHDKRNTNIVDHILDKAKLTTTARNKLSDSDFALPSERKYPIHDAAHVRNALARAAQEIAAGGEAAVDAKDAMPKITAAAKKFGISMSMKKDKNAIVIEKDKSGTWRWVGWVSNNFEDSDGDIIAEVAHKEFVEYLDANPKMAPAFMSWHTPETMRKSLPDFWAYENGFLIFSGPLTDPEAEILLKAATMTDLGMSQQSLVLSRDTSNKRVVTKYRMFEVCDLPLENAANAFTALETFSKEAVDMDYKLYLAPFVGEEKAEILANERTAAMQKELKNAGIKSAEAQTPVAATEQESAIPEHIMKEIMEKLDIPGLNEFVIKANEAIEKVPLLELALKELAASKDDELAKMISPPAQTLAWSQKEKRPSESDSNVIDDKDALMKSKPETGWLSQATGTKPIPASVQ